MVLKSGQAVSASNHCLINDGNRTIIAGQINLPSPERQNIEDRLKNNIQDIPRAVICRMAEVVAGMAAEGINYSVFSMDENSKEITTTFRCDIFQVKRLAGYYRFTVEKTALNTISIDTTDLYQAAWFRSFLTLFPGVIHDIRGHLNNIVINLELAKNASIDFSYKKEASSIPEFNAFENHLNLPIKQAYKLDNSIKLLLEILDTTPGIQMNFNIINMLDDIYSLVKSTARIKGIQLVWESYKEPIFVKGEKSAARRALLQLIMEIVNSTKKDAKLYGNSYIEDEDYIFLMHGNRNEFEERILDLLFNSRIEQLAIDRNTVIVHAARKALADMGGASILKFDDDMQRFELRIRLPRVHSIL